MEYLFKSWGAIKKELKKKFVFVFLDFDGTLAPIVKTPAMAQISDKTKRLLKDLSEIKGFKIAIVSGRSLVDVRNKIGLVNIVYVGNHGLEIEGPKISFKSSVSVKYRKILDKIKNVLEDRLSVFKGVLLEDKGLSLSLHFRLVKKSDVPKVKTIFHENTVIYYVKGQVKIKSGKKVLEVRPSVDWDKGKVVLWLLSRQKFFLKTSNILPIYIGDDETDEDAFKALNEKGLTIFVGKPKESAAKYYLNNSKEVADLLSKLLAIT